MGSICLSSVSILRCAPLTRTENIVLIIPPVVEIIFSTSLVVNNWGTGWRHCFLLTFDSWMYLFLALLDLFTRVVPAVQVQLNVFTILDTLIGIASFIPILFYTLFLFFFTRLELLKLLPVRFQNIARFLLILFIPAIVGLNAVASLIGISRVSENNQIFVGFLEDRDRTLWTFFTSMTLALLTAYQAINFSFTFFRLIKGLMAQRDLEAASSDEAYLFKGIGWMSVGLKLGAVETVIGFAQAGFGGVLTRRILRLLCRACLCIGILKGLDTVENYGEFLSVVSRRRSEKPRGRNARPLISNPRHSTFRQLSPTATEFHLTPGIHKGSEKQDRGLAPRSTTGLVGLSEFASIKSDYAAAQRVTIHFGEGAPKLEMRFSQLDMPSPATIVDSKKQDIAEMNERLSEYYKSTMSDRMNRRATLAHSRAVSTMSTKTTDSVKALRELTPQFPVPAHTARGDRSSWNASPEPMPAKKQPIQSRLSQLMTLEEADETDAASQKRNTKFHLPLKRSSDYQTPTGSTPGTMLFRSDTLTTQRTTPGVESPAQFLPQKVDRYDEPDTGFELSRIDSTARPTAPATRRPSRVSFLKMSDSQHLRDQSISWVQNPYDASAVTPAHSVAEQNDPIINAMSAQSRSLTRIKSVGKVQKKLTPPPSSMTAGHGMRGSIHIEPIFIPPRAPAMVGVEAVQGSDAGSSYAGSPAGQNDTFVPVDRWK